MTSTEQIEVEKCFTCKYDTFTDSKKKKKIFREGKSGKRRRDRGEGIRKRRIGRDNKDR